MKNELIKTIRNKDNRSSLSLSMYSVDVMGYTVSKKEFKTTKLIFVESFRTTQFTIRPFNKPISRIFK